MTLLHIYFLSFELFDMFMLLLEDVSVYTECHNILIVLFKFMFSCVADKR